MPRNYYICTYCNCNWNISWGFTRERPHPDMGLVIASHIELKHPELLYQQVPLTVVRKIMANAARERR